MMIDLYYGYAIEPYDAGFKVGKVGVTVDSRTGKDRETIKNPAYFRLMSDAVNYASQAIAREKIARHREKITLERAYKDFLEVEARMRELAEPIRKLEERAGREAAKK